jgi:RNA polymerase sigma-70 factor (ECF subfamily)
MMARTIEGLWEARVAVESDVARLRKGDPEALGALLERYQNRLYRYLLRMVREPASAEDLFQQTWLRVAERVRHFDAQRSFEPWLFTVARNLAIDYLRRYRPESLDEPLPSGEPREERIASAGESALDRVISEERAEQLADALQVLPAMYREVLTLRFEEEMKLEEIAEVLDAPLSTVKTRLRRGLEEMRKKLETQGGAEVWQ